MWYRHWGLSRHPFDDMDSPYVPLPSHDEALYRLVYAIEQGHRQVIFQAEAGLGKTTVLHRAIDETRSPLCRVVSVRPPSDRIPFLSLIAERLGYPVDREVGEAATWRALGRALRLASLQGFQVILAVDDGNGPPDRATARDLNVLAHSGFGQETRLTVIRVGRPSSEPDPEPEDEWTLAIGLLRLTRSQVDAYLNAKLAVAGASERIFTPRAVTRLHSLSGGIPRGLEQLAALSLMAGAVRRLEVITPDVVDGVARECRGSVSLATAWR